jgi:hypothetical protein
MRSLGLGRCALSSCWSDSQVSGQIRRLLRLACGAIRPALDT